MYLHYIYKINLTNSVVPATVKVSKAVTSQWWISRKNMIWKCYIKYKHGNYYGLQVSEIL